MSLGKSSVAFSEKHLAEMGRMLRPSILSARKKSIFSHNGIVFLKAAIDSHDMVSTSNFELSGADIMKDSRVLPRNSEEYISIKRMAERQAIVESNIGQEWLEHAN